MRQKIQFYLFSSYFTGNYGPRSRYQTSVHRCNDWKLSKTVIIVLTITVLVNLDSIKYFYLPNGSAPPIECVIKRKNRRLCSSRFREEPINTISDACGIYN